METKAKPNGSLTQNQPTAKVRTSKAHAPRPPVMRYNPGDSEIQISDIPSSYSASNRRALLKQSKENLQEPQALKWRRIDNDIEQKKQDTSPSGASPVLTGGDEKPSFARENERELATFYAMFYTKEEADKDWKLLVEEFIPVCFIQVLGDANNPFKIIAVHNVKRVMDFQVTVHSKSAKNHSFVKWQNGSSLYGARFGKEQQALQFHETILRMVSTIQKTAEVLRQPERKTVVNMLSDPKSSALIHTKVSIMVKLPNKESTVISVPGLLTMGELFELICEKEKLKISAHQLSVPKIGGQKVIFDSHTAVGSLKVREVSLIGTGLSESSENSGNLGVGSNVEEIDDLEVMSEESKALDIDLPSGSKKTFMVPMDMSMRKLVAYLCKKENLNPRFHSLQYVDFKHEFLNHEGLVEELKSEELRLMDKRGYRVHKKSNSIPNLAAQSVLEKTTNTNTSRGHRSEIRKSSVMVEAVEDEKSSLSRSVSCEVLANDVRQPNGRTSSGDVKMEEHHGKPPHRPPQPSRPKPYVPRATSVENLSTRKATSSTLTTQVSPVSNVATISPESVKQKRKAPAPPPRPSVRTPGSSPISDSNVSPHNPSISTASSPTTSPSPSQKKRKAPPRPSNLPLKLRDSLPTSNQTTVEIGKHGHVNEINNAGGSDSVALVNKSSPPVFIAPPPPDELPPPLDECATPVCPVDDDDFDMKSLTGDSPYRFYEGMNERRLSQESRGSPEGSPSLVHHSTPQVKSARSIKSNTVAAPRTSQLEEDPLEPPMEFVVPPLEFSNQNGPASEPAKLTVMSGAFNETTSEELVVPPPPLPSVEELVALMTPRKEKANVAEEREESPKTEYSEMSNPVSFDDKECPIPPPEDFANINPPTGFESEQDLDKNKPVKKLTVDKSLFPWIDEPAPTITPVLPKHDKIVHQRQDSSLDGDEDMEDLPISPGPLSPDPDEKMEPTADFLRFLEKKRQGSIDCDIPDESGDEIPFEPNLTEETDIPAMENVILESKSDKQLQEDDDSLKDLKLFALEINDIKEMKKEIREVNEESLNDVKRFAADFRTSTGNKTVELSVKEETLGLAKKELIPLSEDRGTDNVLVNEKTFVPCSKNVCNKDVVVEEISPVTQSGSLKSVSYDPFLLLEKSDENTKSTSKLPFERTVQLQSKEERNSVEEQIVPISEKQQFSSPQFENTKQYEGTITGPNIVTLSLAKLPSSTPLPVNLSLEEGDFTPDTLQESTISNFPSSPLDYNNKEIYSKFDDSDIHGDLSPPLSPDQQVPGSLSTMTTTGQTVIETVEEAASSNSFSEPAKLPEPSPFTELPMKGNNDLSAEISRFTSDEDEKTSDKLGQIQCSQQQSLSKPGLPAKDQSASSQNSSPIEESDVKKMQEADTEKTPETQPKSSVKISQEELPKSGFAKPHSVNSADLQVCSAVKKYLRGNSVGYSTRPRSWVAPSSRDTSGAPKRSSLIWAPDFNPSSFSKTDSKDANQEKKSEAIKLEQDPIGPQLENDSVLLKKSDNVGKGQEKHALSAPELEKKQYSLTSSAKQPQVNVESSSVPATTKENETSKLQDGSFPQINRTPKQSVPTFLESEPKCSKSLQVTREVNPKGDKQRSSSSRNEEIVRLVEKNKEKEKQQELGEETSASKQRENSWFTKQMSLTSQVGTTLSAPSESNEANVDVKKSISFVKAENKPEGGENKIENDSMKNKTLSKTDLDDKLEKPLRLPSNGRKKYEILFASSNSASNQTEKKTESNEDNSSASPLHATRPTSTGKERTMSSSGRKKYEILFSNSKPSEEPKTDKAVSGTVESCASGSVNKLRHQFSAPVLKAPEVKTKSYRTLSESTVKGNDKTVAEPQKPKSTVSVPENAEKKTYTELVLEKKNVPPKVIEEAKSEPYKTVVEKKNVPPKVAEEVKQVRRDFVVEKKKELPKYVIEKKTTTEVAVEAKQLPRNNMAEEKKEQPKYVIEKKTATEVTVEAKQVPRNAMVEEKKDQSKYVIEIKAATDTQKGKLKIVNVEPETDTNVVPTGVVARIKALKESKSSSTG